MKYLAINCILLIIFFLDHRETLVTLSEQYIATTKNASHKLTCSKRRGFQAQVAIDYLR